MDDLPEVIFSTVKGCVAFDSKNGNVVQNLKGPPIVPRTLSLIGEDFLIGAELNKPVLIVWPLAEEIRTVSHMPVPGVVSALAVSNCGSYCVAGIKKDLYVWKVSSGELMKVIPRHYQDITCIRFSIEDSHILSGGKDGHVNVWLLSRLVDIQTSGNAVKPRFTWNHHAYEVTDIYIGCLDLYARVATTSLDMTCRLYELNTGNLLCTVCMDAPLTAVTMDTLEFILFLGDNSGALHRVNIYDRLPIEIHSNELKDSEFRIHQGKIVSLSVSIEGNILISASEDTSIRAWDIQSISCILKIPLEEKVTNAFIALKPTCFTEKKVLPRFSVGLFRRELDSSIRDVESTKFESKMGCKPLSKMLDIHPELVYNPAQMRLDSLIMNGKDSKSSDPESKFQQAMHGETVNELLAVNKQMYAYVTNRAMTALGESD